MTMKSLQVCRKCFRNLYSILKSKYIPSITTITPRESFAHSSFTPPLFVKYSRPSSRRVLIHRPPPLFPPLQVWHALEQAAVYNCCRSCGDLPSVTHELFGGPRGPPDLSLRVPGAPPSLSPKCPWACLANPGLWAGDVGGGGCYLPVLRVRDMPPSLSPIPAKWPLGLPGGTWSMGRRHWGGGLVVIPTNPPPPPSCPPHPLQLPLPPLNPPGGPFPGPTAGRRG